MEALRNPGRYQGSARWQGPLLRSLAFGVVAGATIVGVGLLVYGTPATPFGVLENPALAISAIGILLLVATVIPVLIWRLRHSKRQAVLVLDVALPPDETKPEPLQALSIEGKSEGLWHWDLRTHTLRVSKGWSAIVGWEPEDIGDRPSDWLSLIHPYYAGGVRMDLAAHLKGEKDEFECEYRIRHRDGMDWTPTARPRN